MAKSIEHQDEPTQETREGSPFEVEGLLFPKSDLFKRELIERAFRYRPRPRDIVLSSYPKCDSTYLEIILWKLLHPRSERVPRDDVTNRCLQCIEIAGLDESYRSRSARIVKTYLPFRLIPFYKRAKYIYVVRNPWETCVSYYRLLTEDDDTNSEEFEQFFRLFVRGELGYGNFFTHVIQWNFVANEDNVLILFHENIRHNPRGTVFTVAAFLGEEYMNLLMQDDVLLNDILNATEWDKRQVRRLPKVTRRLLPTIVSEPLYSVTELLWRRRFVTSTCSPKQLELLADIISRKMKNTSIEHMWSGLLEKHALFSL